MATKKKRSRPPAKRAAVTATTGGGANPDRRERKEEARRAREAERKRSARRAAIRRALIFTAVAVVVLVVLSFLTRAGSAKPLSAVAVAAAQAAGCSGVQTPAASVPGGLHLASGQDYTYPDHPATSGYHDPAPLPPTPRVYITPVRETQAVHTLEHGSVIMYYRPSGDGGIGADVVSALGPVATGNHATYLIPYSDLPNGTGFALAAWNKLITCPASITAPQAVTLSQGFVDSFACTNNAPEGKLGDGC